MPATASTGAIVGLVVGTEVTIEVGVGLERIVGVGLAVDNTVGITVTRDVGDGDVLANAVGVVANTVADVEDAAFEDEAGSPPPQAEISAANMKAERVK